MRLLLTFMLIAVCAGTVCANDFYQTNNPFPSKVSSPEFNNIYATEAPAAAKEEYNKKKAGFWNKNNKSTNAVKEEAVNVKEGIQGTPDGSFYVFSR